MIVTSGNPFDEWCEGFQGVQQQLLYPDNKLTPFKLRVIIAGYRTTPRHERFELYLEMGVPLIEPVLRHESLGDRNSLMFIYPERWLSVHEQRNFIPSINSHPEGKNWTQVDILTQNPLMIGGLTSKSIRIVSWEGDDGMLDREFDKRHRSLNKV